MFQLPRDCRIFIALQPAAQWGWNEIFTNKMVYLLDTLVWMQTKDARKKLPRHKPKLFMPDFMPKPDNDITKGLMAADPDTIKDLLARPRK